MGAAWAFEKYKITLRTRHRDPSIRRKMDVTHSLAQHSPPFPPSFTAHFRRRVCFRFLRSSSLPSFTPRLSSLPLLFDRCGEPKMANPGKSSGEGKRQRKVKGIREEKISETFLCLLILHRRRFSSPPLWWKNKIFERKNNSGEEVFARWYFVRWVHFPPKILCSSGHVRFYVNMNVN